MISESPRSVKISAIKVNQPIGDIYVASIPAKTLYDIAYFDIRQLSSENDLDSYLGIQREISEPRVREIAEYVKGDDATFPTGIVIAVDERCAKVSPACENRDEFYDIVLSNYLDPVDPEENILYRQIARVIDGQHRIKGLHEYKKDAFDINVSIFIGADIADQAAIFATVNLAQTKVNKSLAYDLFALSRTKSPERTCHTVAVALDSTKGSPFYRKIKRLGTTTPGRTEETLSQATVVEGLLRYIVRNKIQMIQDRHAGRRGLPFEAATASEARRLVLRPFFVEGRDLELTSLIWNFFEAVEAKWYDAWHSTDPGRMLNRTNGFNGLMRVFRSAYLNFTEPGGLVTTEQFSSLFERVNLSDADFNPERFVPGSSGASALARELLQQMGLEE